MKVVLVTGIWPPDVGGPASHAPELADFLTRRGHQVDVVTTAGRRPAGRAYPVHAVRRSLPPGVRHAAVSLRVARSARAADVVYATSMIGRAAAGSALARRPLVVKLVADPAYERARRAGLFDGDLERFQEHRGGLRVRLLRRARDLALGRARHIVCPSGFLAGRAVAWGVPAARVTVVPNAAPAPPVLGARDDLRRAHGLDGPTLVFAGRVTRQKSLEAGLEAVARTDGVTLLVVGDGPELEAARRRAAELELDGRARFLGSRPRHEVLELLHAADGLLLPSSWENFPHAVVEALAVGSPVIATSVGGVAEVVSDGVNGLLVPPGDVAALAAAVERFFADAALRQRLAAAAAPSVERLQPEAIYERLERILLAAAG